MQTFYSAADLARQIPFDARYINEVIRDRYFVEGRHFVRSFGGRKVLYIWETIKQDILNSKFEGGIIPLSSGGYLNG